MLSPNTGNQNYPLERRVKKNKSDELHINAANCKKFYTSEIRRQSTQAFAQDDSDQKNIERKPFGKWMNPDKKRLEKMEPYQHSYLRKYYLENNKNLPEKLTELFTPLKCNLCNCTMGSTVTAKDHYEGKKHISNIKKWLFKHPEFEDKYFTYERNKAKLHDMNKFYSSQCNIMMSSQQQAQLHYLGKKHHSIINNELFFLYPKKVHWGKCVTVSENRNNIVDRELNAPFFNKEEQRKDITFNPKFFCTICQVACPSEITYNDHLAGTKHNKRIRIDLEPSSVVKDNILDDVLKYGKKITSPKDLSVYRTPSGKYYCHSCNVTINSAVQFLQHSESRKHKHKLTSFSDVKLWK